MDYSKILGVADNALKVQRVLDKLQDYTKESSSKFTFLQLANMDESFCLLSKSAQDLMTQAMQAELKYSRQLIEQISNEDD